MRYITRILRSAVRIYTENISSFVCRLVQSSHFFFAVIVRFRKFYFSSIPKPDACRIKEKHIVLFSFLYFIEEKTQNCLLNSLEMKMKIVEFK